MKKIYIICLAIVFGVFMIPVEGIPGDIGDDITAIITTRGDKRIPPQQYLSNEIALKRPVIIKGKITDKSGEAIPAVMVTVLNLQDYKSIRDTTGDDGAYRIELPVNKELATYKMSILFLSGEFEFDSNKIFLEKAYQESSKAIVFTRPSNSMCLNELLYLAGKKTNPKSENVTLIINIAHQKESILAKKAIESAKDIMDRDKDISIPISIKERLIARFEEMRKIYPKKLLYFEALGMLQYELKNFTERNYRKAAINRFRAAVKLGSVNIDVYHRMIDLLTEAGYYGESIQVAVRAIELFGDEPDMYDDKQEFELLIRRSKFHFREQDKGKAVTAEEKSLRKEWSLTLIEDQREIYRQAGYPKEIKNYKRREGVQQEWWYYDKGICYVFLNGMLNTKKEF